MRIVHTGKIHNRSQVSTESLPEIRHTAENQPRSGTMDGLLVFDQQSDVIFAKLNGPMRQKLHELAVRQGLVDKDTSSSTTVSTDLDPNVLVQLFSPLVASQRIMFCQFDNSYTSLECEDDLNFVFEEFLGYLLLQIGNASVQALQRSVGVGLTLMKRVCGPDLNLLKSHSDKLQLVTGLLDTWQRLYATDQAVLVEGVERLLVNSDLKSVAQRTLESVTENLKQDPHSQRSHAVLFVGNKLLSMYSSKQAQELAACDLLFLSLFHQSLATDVRDRDSDTNGTSISTHLLLLQGQVNGPFAGCIPHIVHLVRLDADAVLVLLIEYGSLPVASGLYDIFYALHKTRMLQMQNDVDALKPAFDKLDGYVRQELDALRRAKLSGSEVEAAQRRFTSRWEVLRKKYVELFRGSDRDLVVTIESNLPGFMDALKELFRRTCIECAMLASGLQRVREIATMVDGRLLEFGEFLHVRTAMGSAGSAMGAYLEEFPGLVHFVHVDRTTGRMIAPTVGADVLIPLSKIWSMVEFTRGYLQRGHMSVMWKDAAFSYSYMLWFEDQSGNALKPKELPNSAQLASVRPQVVPGILAGEFYQWLVDTCFPKAGAKVKCFELYCVHLGLASASCVLEHNRRLAATIMEVTGMPGSGLNGL